MKKKWLYRAAALVLVLCAIELISFIFFSVFRDRFGLRALFGTDSRIGTRRIDERDDRQSETRCEFHQALGFAVALGRNHSEIAPDIFLRVATALLREDDDAPSA